MKNLVALLCMISALVVSVLSIKCYSCYSGDPETFKETVTECDYQCMTVSYQEGDFYKTYKGCEMGDLCSRKDSGKCAHGDPSDSLRCCSADLCNTGGNSCYPTPVISTTTKQPSWMKVTRMKIQGGPDWDIWISGRKK